MQPARATVVRHEEPAVVAEQEPVRIGRIDDQLVVIEVQRAAVGVVQSEDAVPESTPGGSAIERLEAAVAEDIDVIGVPRVHAHVGELPAEDAEDLVQVLGVHLTPVLAAIVGAIHCAADERSILHRGRRAIVDEEIEHLGLAGRDVDAGAAEEPVR